MPQQIWVNDVNEISAVWGSHRLTESKLRFASFVTIALPVLLILATLIWHFRESVRKTQGVMCCFANVIRRNCVRLRFVRKQHADA